MTAEQYLDTIGVWRDPFPGPYLFVHDGVSVVRDDMLRQIIQMTPNVTHACVGSKVRGADYLIGHDRAFTDVKEWVYGSCPANGYAQISLAALCQRYQKRAVLFMAQRNLSNLHPYQQRGIDLGASYQWVPNGMLSVTQARARAYVAEKPQERELLPIGLDHPTVIGSFIRVARSLPITPDYVWSVGSSGTLTRSLQLAWPNAEVHVVQTGHKLTPKTAGRAIVHVSPYRFDAEVSQEDAPPFPSALSYDAKAWSILRDWRNETKPSGTILFWNVGE